MQCEDGTGVPVVDNREMLIAEQKGNSVGILCDNRTLSTASGHDDVPIIFYGILALQDGFTAGDEPGAGARSQKALPQVETRYIHEAAVPYGTPSGGTETILLAEDDPMVRELEEYMLSEFGYTVLTAADGQEAVELFRKHRDEIDLVLLDVIMPHKNGTEAYMEIRSLAPRTRVIFISGYTSDLIGDGGLLVEETTLLLKPISLTELVRKIREVLDTPVDP